MGRDLQYYERRLAGVAHKRVRNKLDALLFTHAPDVRYLCGFTGSSAALVFTRQGRAFFTDGRYTQQASDEVAGAQIMVSDRNPMVRALQWIKECKVKTLGLDFAHFTVTALHEVQQQLGKQVEIEDCSRVVEGFRMRKDAEEVARIRLAARLGAALFPVAIKHSNPGVKESQVAAEIEYEARRRGAEKMSFETIVAGGVRSALPHGRASNARLPQRGFVVLDFGVILTGYCSDMTRTVHLGKPDGRARTMYQAVLRAQLAAIQKVRPGVAVSAVDQAARSVLERAGFGQFFTHSTGHGVGLEIHEAPRIAGKQSQKLQPGMVITIEPGIYIPGEGGVRIEDMVLVTERGCEVLTPTTKRLITL
jgi:Xaa-Pro aminopeptidase